MDERTFVVVQESNREVLAHYWSKKSENRCTEEGKKTSFPLLMLPCLQGGTSQCQERIPCLMISPMVKSETVVSDCLAPLAMQDADQEAYLFLTPSRILRWTPCLWTVPTKWPIGTPNALCASPFSWGWLPKHAPVDDECKHFRQTVGSTLWDWEKAHKCEHFRALP